MDVDTSQPGAGQRYCSCSGIRSAPSLFREVRCDDRLRIVEVFISMLFGNLESAGVGVSKRTDLAVAAPTGEFKAVVRWLRFDDACWESDNLHDRHICSDVLRDALASALIGGDLEVDIVSIIRQSDVARRTRFDALRAWNIMFIPAP